MAVEIRTETVYSCDLCNAEVREKLPLSWVLYRNADGAIFIADEEVRVREPVHFCSIDHFTRWVSDELKEIYSNAIATDKDFAVKEDPNPEQRFGRREGEEHHEHFERRVDEQQALLEEELQLPEDVQYDRRAQVSAERPVRPFEPGAGG